MAIRSDEVPIPYPGVPPKEQAPSKINRRRFLELLGGTAIVATAGALYISRDKELQKPPEAGLGAIIPASLKEVQKLSVEEIQNLAVLPEIDQIGEKYMSTVSPDLQKKARQAGYKLIYQGDSSDTVGRTVVTKDRQTANKDWSIEDQGFGRAGTDVRGIFKAWVPDPEDPTQKDHVYALIVDPISQKETLARLELQQFNPNSDIRPTWFTVDDLDNGPSEIERRSKEVGRQPGQELTADGLPSPTEPPMKQSKKLTDFPTLNDLLRQKGLTLTDLAEPGDYVKIGMQTAGVDYTKGINTYKTDKNGVSRAITFGIRRFGGEKQWQAEIQRSK